jgi:hypothetical protein
MIYQNPLLFLLAYNPNGFARKPVTIYSQRGLTAKNKKTNKKKGK